MAEVRYYGLGILAHINNTKKGRVDDHFDINSVLFLFREPDIFLLTRYSPFYLRYDWKKKPHTLERSASRKAGRNSVSGLFFKLLNFFQK